MLSGIKYITSTFALLSLISCIKDNRFDLQGYKKLSSQEMIDRARIGNWPNPEEIVYLSESGETISLENMKKLNYDSIAFDDYIDYTDKVTLAIIREATEEDLLVRKLMKDAFEEGPELKVFEVECNCLGEVLDNIRFRDQENRRERESYSFIVDHENLEMILNIIKSCGMPTLENVTEEQVQTIWLVIQHSKLKYQKEYLPILKRSAKRGDLSIREIYMLEDRIQVALGFPQIYGTQICTDSLGNQILCDVLELDKLNERRASAGFAPIQEYLDHWGIVLQEKE